MGLFMDWNLQTVFKEIHHNIFKSIGIYEFSVNWGVKLYQIILYKISQIIFERLGPYLKSSENFMK